MNVVEYLDKAAQTLELAMRVQLFRKVTVAISRTSGSILPIGFGTYQRLPLARLTSISLSGGRSGAFLLKRNSS
jgi:hypothetical protein